MNFLVVALLAICVLGEFNISNGRVTSTFLDSAVHHLLSSFKSRFDGKPSTLKISSTPSSIARANIQRWFGFFTPTVATPYSFLKRRWLSPTEQLATTPLFYVGNFRGNSYLQDDLQSGQPDQKAIIYFMSSEDANDFLDELSQSSPASMNELRLCTTTFEKIFSQMRSRKQSRKYGRQPLDLILRIQPSSRQFKNAQHLLGGLQKFNSKAIDEITVPMFAADGLLLKRLTGEHFTPYYFAYEDLVDDLSRLKMKERDFSLSKDLKIRVVDFTKVICLGDEIKFNQLEGDKANYKAATIVAKARSKPGIVPPRREIDMVRKYYRNEVLVKNEFSRTKLLK